MVIFSDVLSRRNLRIFSQFFHLSRSLYKRSSFSVIFSPGNAISLSFSSVLFYSFLFTRKRTKRTRKNKVVYYDEYYLCMHTQEKKKFTYTNTELQYKAHSWYIFISYHTSRVHFPDRCRFFVPLFLHSSNY